MVANPEVNVRTAEARVALQIKSILAPPPQRTCLEQAALLQGLIEEDLNYVGAKSFFNKLMERVASYSSAFDWAYGRVFHQTSAQKLAVIATVRAAELGLHRDEKAVLDEVEALLPHIPASKHSSIIDPSRIDEAVDAGKLSLSHFESRERQLFQPPGNMRLGHFAEVVSYFSLPDNVDGAFRADARYEIMYGNKYGKDNSINNRVISFVNAVEQGQIALRQTDQVESTAYAAADALVGSGDEIAVQMVARIAAYRAWRKSEEQLVTPEMIQTEMTVMHHELGREQHQIPLCLVDILGAVLNGTVNISSLKPPFQS